MILNIKNGIEEHTCGYESCNTNQVLVFGGPLTVRNLCMSELVFGSESFKTTVLSRYEGSCMLHKSEWCQKQKCLHIPISCGYQVL